MNPGFHVLGEPDLWHSENVIARPAAALDERNLTRDVNELLSLECLLSYVKFGKDADARTTLGDERRIHDFDLLPGAYFVRVSGDSEDYELRIAVGSVAERGDNNDVLTPQPLSANDIA